MIHTIVFWGICAVIFLIPLPFGGVEEWAVFGFEAAVAVLLAVYAGGAGKKPEERRTGGVGEGARAPRFIAVLFAVFLGITLLQIIPLPPDVVGALSPRAEGIHAGGEAAVGAAAGWRTLSLAPNLTVYELLKYLSYAAFAFLVFRSVGTKKEAERLVLLLILGGVFQAVYGLLMYLSGSAAVFGWKNKWALGSASGTFVNRDHYSAFLEMVFPLAVGYLLAKADFFSLKKGISWREKVLWFGQERLAKAGILALVAVVIGLAIFFSRSRSGFLIFFLTLFLMAIALSAGGKAAEAGERRGGGARARRIIRTVALAVVFAAVTIGIRPVIERFSLESLKREARPEFFRLTTEMIRAFPLFGVGAGNYVHVYGMFEREDLGGILDHAHNDYLEVLAESGVVGGACLTALALGALGYVFVRWMRRRDHFVRGVVLGCMAGAAAVLLHSLTDFSLRMPANAVYCVTLSALALKIVKIRDVPQRDTL